jgi:6-phosphofructokinase 1
LKIGILTGGGDCPGLNPAIRGFVLQALQDGHETWGIYEGWKGLIENRIEPEPLTAARVEPLIRQGGTLLFSSRTNPYKRPEHIQAVKDNVVRNGFDAIVALGGEDTLGVACRLWQEGVPTVGTPKTVDNDLSETDYTFGFDTSVQVAVEAMDRLHDTARSHSRILVLEVMGRHAGWVALNTAIAGGADWVLLPEEKPDLDAMCAHLTTARARGKNYGIVVVSEGIVLTSQDDGAPRLDAFGHAALKDNRAGERIAYEIEARTGFETRATVMGYTQRGGTPTSFDRVLATRLGIRAARCVHERDFGKMVALRGTEIVTVPLEHAVGVLRTVPRSLLADVACLFRASC